MGSDFAIVAHEAVDGIFDAATHRDGPTLVVSTEGRMDREAFLGAVRDKKRNACPDAPLNVTVAR
ncbi:hypothetical protein ACVHNB_20105 [Streptomyces sp. YJ-C3]